jgi:hypothetical protein
MNGSEIRRSCGDTVPMLLVEEALLFMSNTDGRAGDEYAVVEAPPSKAVKSSKSRSERFILACGIFPVLCENNGTGGRCGRVLFGLCKFKAEDEDGADEA